MQHIGQIQCCEILSSQKFFVSKLKPEEQYKRCSYCFAKCYALIPCTECQMMYCSKDCQIQAFNSYHRIECKLFSYKRICQSCDFQIMAIKMLLIGTEQGTKLKSLMSKLPVKKIFAEKVDPTNKAFVNDYQSTLRLSRTFNPALVKCFTFSALEVVTLLAQVSFFENNCDNMTEVRQDYMNEMELYAAMLLINHTVSLKLNRFSINQLNSSNLMSPNRESPIATGVCTFSNLMNHSCNPSTLFFVRNGEHVSFAVRPIKKGEQMFTSYFNSYTNNSPEKRATTSLEFDFICQCEACIEKWPVNDDLIYCRVEFLNNNKAEVLGDLVEMIFPIAKKGIAEFHDQEVLEIICRCCKWLHGNLRSPCAAIGHCQSLLSDFMRLLHDDFFREHLAEVRNSMQVEVVLRAVMNHVSLMS